MAIAKRIIPCLDIKNGKVVKGVNFVGMEDVGDPVIFAKKYEEQGADEIVFLDITATVEKRDTTYPLIKRAASELSIPITVGGGIRSVEDFRKVLDSGADKASVNSAAVTTAGLLKELSAQFGAQRVVAAIDGKKTGSGFKVFINGGTVNTGLDLVEWARECEVSGAGEILLTSMDADGTRDGYDIAMTKAVCDAVAIPVVASGGCGSISDIVQVFGETDCAAALAASLFHYGIATVGDVKQEMKRVGIDI